MENKVYENVEISRVHFNDYNDKGFGENAAIDLPITIVDYKDGEETASKSFTIAFQRLESTLLELCGKDFRILANKIYKVNKESLPVIDSFLFDATITFERCWHEKGDELPQQFMQKGTFDACGYHTIITGITLADTDERKELIKDSIQDFKENQREDKVFTARLSRNLYD